MVIGKHFTKYYFKYGFLFIVGILALVFVDFFQLEIPEIIGNIIDGIEFQTLTKEQILDYAIKMLGVAIVVFVGRFLWRVCIFGNGVKIEADIRNEMFAHMEKLSSRYFSENKTGALMALYTNDLGMIRQAFASGTLMLFDALALGSLAFVKMIKLDWKLTIICFIPLIFVSAFSMLMRKRISRKVKRNLDAFADLSDYVQEDFTGIQVIKAYVKEKKRQMLFKRYNDENMDTCIDYVKEQSLVGSVIGSVLGVITILIILIGGYTIYLASLEGFPEGSFTVGELTTFNAYFGSLIWPIMAIGDLINLRSQSKASEERVSKLLDEVPEINDDLVKFDAPIMGNIKFNGLDFTYPNSNNKVLENISFDVKQGEMVGIMGATGSGKTTIVELLLRLYNVEENKILLDGLDIMGYSLEQVRTSIAYVPQENFLFKQAIDENISFALPKVDADKVEQAAYASGISKDVSEFKDGYHTIVGERGVTVSGGQKQRISIARALIKDAPVLIMDDSLSAVDTLTERHILTELKKIRENKTTIIIAHRISTLESLDKIIVVNDGKIDAVGRHEELLESCRIYQHEVHLQELEKELEG
ncbi:MAG: ABC transporter ATP-binding protein [Bacilli bacterium]|nr:ABC transporter ATP-binding protein [Bacilli bacterium]